MPREEKKTLQINRKSSCVKIVSGRSKPAGFSSVQWIQPETHSHQSKQKKGKKTPKNQKPHYQQKNNPPSNKLTQKNPTKPHNNKKKNQKASVQV